MNPPTIEAGRDISTITASVADAANPIPGISMVTADLSQMGVTHIANLSGSQANASSTSTGSATFVLDTVNNTLKFNTVFSGLLGNETAAHIHGPAPPGVNAGILFPAGSTLPPGSPKVGVWNYPEEQEANITAGLTYVNIHSDLFPGGEIRGQILPTPRLNMTLVSGNLTNGTWQAGVISLTAAGSIALQLNASNIGNFTTAAIPLNVQDTTAPAISNINATPTVNSALINWTTDEISQSFVRFGTASGVYTNTTSISSDTLFSVRLTGLERNTTYFYIISSSDQTGNSATSAENSFTTRTSGFTDDVAVYDFNANNIIERDEAIIAVVDFFAGRIPRQQAVNVVLAFFG